ncbi:MAG: hypothetical protein K9I35_06395, partial [Flavobacterium sp.]|nr:hypothetical protein [Flavobacterium sp.]
SKKNMCWNENLLADGYFLKHKRNKQTKINGVSDAEYPSPECNESPEEKKLSFAGEKERPKKSSFLDVLKLVF